MKKYDEEAIRRWFDNADGTHVKRWLVTAILVGSVLAMVTVVASADTIYVPDNYSTIQQAVNNANNGDIIIVRDGTYTENVEVNKRLTIQSENGSANCIVNAASSFYPVFDITANYVNITGFTVKGATFRAGIYIDGVSYCNIKNNNLMNSQSGIYMSSSSSNNIINNTISNNKYGIYMSSSSSNNVSCNWVHNNSDSGFYLSDGSTGNTIEHNNIITNGELQSDGSYHYQFSNDQSDAVEAKYNFWGYGMTDDTIDASIYDDEEGKGKVTFLPRLTGPSPCAPVPELSTVVLTILGLVSLTGYVQLRKGKK